MAKLSLTRASGLSRRQGPQKPTGTRLRGSDSHGRRGWWGGVRREGGAQAVRFGKLRPLFRSLVFLEGQSCVGLVYFVFWEGFNPQI